MDERITQAAATGDIIALHQLIGENVNILEVMDELPFVDTPLHVAAYHGNIKFSLELMNIKHSFARKLTPSLLSPIHLAVQNGQTELVRRLLQVDGDLVRVKGREGLTPFHYVVESGDLDMLEEVLRVCPNSVTDVTVENDTALHIALKKDKLLPFKFLVTWLGENASENSKLQQKTLLNWKDNDGNTALQIAVAKNDTQAVRHLLAWGYNFVDVNHKNLVGDTAWDILQKGQTQVQNEEIRNMLRGVKAKSSSSLSTFNRYEKYERLPKSSYFQFLKTDFKREMRKLSEDRRNLLLVVAVLLVTVSFQVILSPPGGLWQDDGRCNTTEAGGNETTDISNNTLPKTKAGFIMPDTNNKVVCEHKAGTAIAFEDSLFPVFLACNTITFVISNSLIIFLLPSGYMKIASFALHVTFCFSYCYVLLAIVSVPHGAYTAGIVAVVSALFIFVVLNVYCNKEV